MIIPAAAHVHCPCEGRHALFGEPVAQPEPGPLRSAWPHHPHKCRPFLDVRQLPRSALLDSVGACGRIGPHLFPDRSCCKRARRHLAGQDGRVPRERLADDVAIAQVLWLDLANTHECTPLPTFLSGGAGWQAASCPPITDTPEHDPRGSRSAKRWCWPQPVARGGVRSRSRRSNDRLPRDRHRGPGTPNAGRRPL